MLAARSFASTIQSQTFRILLILLIPLLLTTAYLFFVPPAQAITKIASPSPQIATTSATTQAFVPSPLPQYSPQSPQYMNLLVVNFAHTVSCLAEGTSIIDQPCLGLVGYVKDNQLTFTPQELRQNSEGGVLGFASDLISLTYATPPIRTSEYIGGLAQKMNLVQPAYAQVIGTGAGVIKPVEKLWELSRNIAYLGITIIFLIVGIMILFRRKLNPQTVISVQSALPGLVIGLILITFSYLIAATLIDTAFIGTGAVREVFVAAGFIKPDSQQHNLFQVFSAFFTPNWDDGWTTAREVGTSLSFLKQGTIGWIVKAIALFTACKLGAALGGFIGGVVPVAAGIAAAPVTAGISAVLGPIMSLVTGFAANGIGQGVGCVAAATTTWLALENSGIVEQLVGLIVYLVLVIAVFIAMARILFGIINSYVSLIILTLTAPLRFLLGSVPGSKSGGFTPWLKEMLAHLLTFPVYYITFIVVAYILGGGIGQAFGIAPERLKELDFSGGTVPFLGDFSTVFLRVILGYGILLISPNIPEMIKGALGVKDPGYGKMAIGGALAGFNIGKTGFNKLNEPFLKERKAREEIALKKRIEKTLNPAKQPGSIQNTGTPP